MASSSLRWSVADFYSLRDTARERELSLCIIGSLQKYQDTEEMMTAGVILEF